MNTTTAFTQAIAKLTELVEALATADLFEEEELAEGVAEWVTTNLGSVEDWEPIFAGNDWTVIGIRVTAEHGSTPFDLTVRPAA